MPSSVGPERREVHYSGRVQGVGFRYTARRAAASCAVTGFVRNLPDGRVQLVVEGPAEEIDRYLAAVNAEMERYIDGADVRRLPASGEFDDFDIRH